MPMWVVVKWERPGLVASVRPSADIKRGDDHVECLTLKLREAADPLGKPGAIGATSSNPSLIVEFNCPCGVTFVRHYNRPS